MPAFYSKLFRKAFLSLLLALLIWLPVFYWLTVPLINRLAYEVEETAGRTILENVVQIVAQSHRDLEAWRQSALEAHQRELRTVLAVVASQAALIDAEVKAGRLSREAGRRQFLDWLRRLRFGNADYVWAATPDSFLVAHPIQEFDRRDARDIRDTRGNLVVPPMVAAAQKDGEGFLPYWWPRLETGREAEKLGYFRALPAWGLIVGTGVYIDDIEAEIRRRREAMVASLRTYLHGVRLARTGYVLVMDGQFDLVVHPYARIEGTSAARLPVPGTDQSLAQLLAAASRRPDRTTHYLWNRPEDPDNYTYRKVAWMHYVPEYDWYLGATAYVDDLGTSGDRLRDRILLAFLAGLAITAAAAWFFIRRLTAPILRLAAVARRNDEGDLSAVGDLRRDDEIGDLANAFNGMVGRLKGQIGHLEERVAERTRELEAWGGRLEAEVAERTAEVRESEARFRALVDQSVAGIFVIQDFRFRYVNQGFVDLHGYAGPAEVIAAVGPLDPVAPADRDRVEAVIGRLLAGQDASCDIEFAARGKDGRAIVVEVGARSFDYGGRPAIIGVAIDVTERRAAEAAREQALAAAETLLRLKSEFIANMSHEMRTPLNGIIGLAHVGQRAKDLDKAREVSGRILESGRRLLGVVTTVLDFSRLESGRLTLDNGYFDPRALLAKSVAPWEQAARAKGLAFAAEVAPDLPAEIWGDRTRLAQIVDVLLANAVKFTAAGQVSLRLAADESGLTLTVADTGIGMTPEETAALFRPFEQADGSATRQYGGIGLGLALAQRLAALMGGRITVDSRAGDGSTFRFELPLPNGGQRPRSADYSI